MRQEDLSGSLRKLCSNLTQDADRWIVELRLHGIRPTLAYGMMASCSTYVEQIIRACVRVVLSVTSEDGGAVLLRVRRDGKLEKLTIGQLIRLLKDLLPVVKGRAGWEHIADDDESWSVLDAVRCMRNDLVHAHTTREDAWRWIEYIQAAKHLCRIPLVQAAIVAQDGEGTNE